jgi:ABC-type nitrate/sulfonate/bicarbonate transport system permease component
MLRRTNIRRIRLIFKFVGFFGFLSIPHIANKLGANPQLFITWDGICKEFWMNLNHHLQSLMTTFYMGAISIIISIVFGTTLGIVFSYFNKWIGYFEALAKFIWSVPLIAVAVYLNIFIKNQNLYIVITGVFLGIFPIISFVFKKANEPNEGILSLAASFNLTKYEEYKYLRAREVIRNLVFPLAQSVPLAYIGVTMGEFTWGRTAGSSNSGLGSDFQFAMQYSRFEKVYVAIILMVFLVYITGEIFEILASRKKQYQTGG